MEAFSVFDMHNNGYIGLDELKHLMSKLGEGLNPEEVEGMEKATAYDSEKQVQELHSL